MAKLDKLISDVKKLYTKRTALTAQILGIEAKIAAEVKAAEALAKKPAKAPAPKKPVAVKKAEGTKKSGPGRPKKQVSSEK